MKKIKGTIKNSPTGGSLSKLYTATVGKLGTVSDKELKSLSKKARKGATILKSLRKKSPTGGSLKVKKRKRLLK
jgi:hypothetical protein